MDALSEAIQKVGAAMYESSKSADQPASPNQGGQSASQPGPTPTGDDKKDSGPVDAEFKEVPK
jgi:hypothetical protein